MLGHQAYMAFKAAGFHVKGTVRSLNSAQRDSGIFLPKDIFSNIDISDFSSLEHVLNAWTPHIVVNCIGATTRKLSNLRVSDIIEANSLLPQLLNEWCLLHRSRLIHFSTDCVFDGKNGPYQEDHNSDARDLYGLSKILGEVKDSPCALTIRSSIIGRELSGKTELLEWILAQKGKEVQGFTEAIYSGITTNVMARIIVQIARDFPLLQGLYQISSEAISKADLISLVNKMFSLSLHVHPNADYKSNKALDGSRFFKDTGIVIPSWPEMIYEIAHQKNFSILPQETSHDL